MRNGKHKIILKIAGYQLPVWVSRENDEERIYRRAARQINDLIERYSIGYDGMKKSEEQVSIDLILKAVLHISKHKIEADERNDTQPYEDKIKELSDLLGDV